LRSEMSAETMHETVALRDAIARGAPIAEMLDAPKAPSKREPLATPFVGRERELQQLRAHWGRAASGAGALVLVRGEAGIGKSRLVSELALVVESEGGRVVGGATNRPEHGPYECVAEALRQGVPMISALPLPPAVLAAVAELVPELRTRRADLPTLARLDERSERARLFDAIAQVFVALARPRPLLVIFEDVQWADAASLELIGLLAQRIANAPAFAVATCREEQVAFPKTLRSAARVMLGPLDATAVATLATTIAPVEASESDFARTVYERSGGNALFATEILLDAARGGYDAAAIPTSITEIVAGRLESLTPSTQMLAQVAAVAGAEFAFDVAGEATGFSDAQVLSGLDELLDRHLIRESTEQARFYYAFTHDLVRQAIYDAIPLDVRMRRHLRIGRVIQNAYANEVIKPAGEIALHFDRGGDALAAARWYLVAGQRAASLYANEEARELASRGLELEFAFRQAQGDAGDDTRRLRFDLLLIREDMNFRSGQRDAVGADLASLSILSQQLDIDSELTVLRLMTNRAHYWGELPEEMAAAARFRARADASGDPRWLAQAIVFYAAAESHGMQNDQGLASALEARELCERVGDDAGQVRAVVLASAACTHAGRHDEAVRYADTALRLATTGAEPMLQLIALGCAFAQSYETQQYGRAAQLAHEQLKVSKKFGHRGLELSAHANLAPALWHLWCVDESLEHYRAAIALEEAIGVEIEAMFSTFARLLADLGAFDEAMRSCKRAESIARRRGLPMHAADAADDCAYISWQHGAIEPMRRALDRAGNVEGTFTRRLSTSLAVNRARLLRHDGRFDESAMLLESTLDDLRALHRPIDEIVTIDEIAATHLAAGELERAVASVETSEALAERLEDQRTLYNRVEHHWIAYRVCRAAGDDAHAVAALRAAEKAYEQRSGAISDASLRALFEAIPLHRELRAAYRKRS
jgi:tetratricopeptide (TPR) repeat protein